MPRRCAVDSATSNGVYGRPDRNETLSEDSHFGDQRRPPVTLNTTGSSKEPGRRTPSSAACLAFEIERLVCPYHRPSSFFVTLNSTPWLWPTPALATGKRLSSTLKVSPRFARESVGYSVDTG